MFVYLLFLLAAMGELKTFLWDLTGADPAGGAPPARFEAVTTFAADAGCRFAIELPDFGTFVPPPCRGVALSGIVGGEGPKIIARTETRGCDASDSYRAEGQFKAAPVDPPPP